MEPIITMSHYDIPLHLVTEYGGFGNRKVIDFFVNYGKVLVERFKGRVKYWIVCNQVNLVPTVQFGSLGIYDDQAENMEELMYQAVHNQFVACAKSRKSDIRLIRMLSLVRCWQTVPSIRQPAVQRMLY